MAEGEQYTLITDTTFGPEEMYVANYIQGRNHPGERWYLCHICAFEFPKSKVVLDGEQAYCIPHKHYTLIGKRRGG